MPTKSQNIAEYNELNIKHNKAVQNKENMGIDKKSMDKALENQRALDKQSYQNPTEELKPSQQKGTSLLKTKDLIQEGNEIRPPKTTPSSPKSVTRAH